MIRCKNIYKNNSNNVQEYINLNINNNILYIEMYKIEEAENKKFRYNLSFKKQYNLREIFAPNTVYYIYSDKNNEFSNVVKMGITEGDKLMFCEAYKLNADDNIVIYFGNNVNEVLVIVPKLYVFDNVNVQQYNNLRVSQVILQEYPIFKNTISKLDAKRKCLAGINVNESLSGLESQIDLLSLIVKKIISKYPDLQYDTEIVSFFNALSLNSVNTLKSNKEMLEEMNKQKTIIRNKQREYYESINK